MVCGLWKAGDAGLHITIFKVGPDRYITTSGQRVDDFGTVQFRYTRFIADPANYFGTVWCTISIYVLKWSVPNWRCTDLAV